MSDLTFSDLFNQNAFVERHLGTDQNDKQALLNAVGFNDL